MNIDHDRDAVPPVCRIELSTMERIILGYALRECSSDLVSRQSEPLIDMFLSHIKEMVEQLEADPDARD